LYIWNSHLGTTQFNVVKDSTVPRAAGDRRNHVYFSGDVNGQAWGSGVLAVTLLYSSGSTQVEADVVFNNRLSWNSYRGPMRTSNNGTRLHDFHRVALHEFGHALGLNHPDEDSQVVSALMNSRISSIDALTTDDIAGGQALYGGGTPIVAPPVITTHPTNRTVVAGQGTTFNVVATSTAPISYRWMKSGAALSGATSSTFSITSVAAADAGSYSVVVSNSGGSVTSAAGILIVHTLPTIVTPPADQTVGIGEPLRLAVVASSPSAISYAWRKDNTALTGATRSTYEVAAAEFSDGGSYTVVVTTAAGSVTSRAARVTVIPVGPTVAAAPVAQTAKGGGGATFTVAANGTPPFTYQWFKDAQEIAGATAATLSLPLVRAGDAGAYSVRISNDAGSITTSPATLTVLSSRLVNLSARAFVPAGGTLTPGFFIRGSGRKPLLIRAVGPTLRLFGIESALPEARLEVIAQTGAALLPGDEAYHALTENEAAVLVGAFPLEPGARDAVLQASLTARGYTVRVSPGNDTMLGITLAEIYDADSATAPAQLVNVSTLGFVGSGEEALTAGFVISGNAPKRLLIRAVGPGLTPFGVANTVADPQLSLVRQGASDPLATNNDWSGTEELRAAFRAAGAFELTPGSGDAALIVTLDPGAYTVQVSSDTPAVTGQALVEIYDLDP
jgi:hypothetical protein